MGLPFSKPAIGISIGKHHIAGAVLAHGKNSSTERWTIEETDEDLLAHTGYQALEIALRTTLDEVNAWIGRRYIPIHVALPDPVVHTHSLRFDSIPRHRARQRELVCWQLEKAFHAKPSTLRIAYRKNDTGCGGVRIFATAVAGGLLEAIEAAFSDAKIAPETIQMAALYRANIVRKECAPKTAQIWLERDYVSIAFPDSRGMPYLVRSFWRRVDDNSVEEELEEIAAEIERTVHAFSVTHREDAIDRLHIYFQHDYEREWLTQHLVLRDVDQFIAVDEQGRMFAPFRVSHRIPLGPPCS